MVDYYKEYICESIYSYKHGTYIFLSINIYIYICRLTPFICFQMVETYVLGMPHWSSTQC